MKATTTTTTSSPSSSSNNSNTKNVVINIQTSYLQSHLLESAIIRIWWHSTDDVGDDDSIDSAKETQGLSSVIFSLLYKALNVNVLYLWSTKLFIYLVSQRKLINRYYFFTKSSCLFLDSYFCWFRFLISNRTHCGFYSIFIHQKKR